MAKLTQVKNGEYIGGNKYVINSVGNGKSTVDFSPDQVIQAGTPVGAEILNEMQKNGLYTLNGSRGIVGQEEQYSINFEGFTDFDCETLNCLFIPDASSTGNNISLLINQVKYTFDEMPSLIGGEVYEIQLNKTKKTASFRKNNNVLITINTIEDLKKLNKVKVGNIVELLGYYQAGDGANHKRVIADSDDGSGVQLENGLYANIVHNGEVNVSWFGAKGDGVTDDTESIRKTIKYAYDNYGQFFGRGREFKITFLAKTYIVNGSLIDTNLGVRNSRMSFVGKGMHSTVIQFTGTLFDNVDIFSFTQFEKICFISDYTGEFMKMTSNIKNAPQGINFNLCRFYRIKTIIETSGDTMCSEVSFVQCRIADSNEDCKLFIINNSQGVNWRFIATDIETFKGICFELLSGFQCSVYSGSIIPIENGVVISVPENANTALFGAGNSPDITFFSSRFELRNTTKLISKLNYNAGLEVYFENCGMGGYNITTQTVLELCGSHNIQFTRCSNMQKFSMLQKQKYTPQYPSSKLIFKETDLNKEDFLSKCTFEIDGTQGNYHGFGNIIIDEIVYNYYYKGFNSNKYLQTQSVYEDLIRYPHIELKGNSVVNTVKEINYGNCGRSIRKVIVGNYKKDGYGSANLIVNVYSKNKQNLLAEFETTLNSSKVSEVDVIDFVDGIVIETICDSGYETIPRVNLKVEVL